MITPNEVYQLKQDLWSEIWFWRFLSFLQFTGLLAILLAGLIN